MNKLNDGGPAFPRPHSESDHMYHDSQEGMTLRDYFAANASEDDVKAYMPRTIGETADLCVKLGWITDAARTRDVVTSYGSHHVRKLRAWARFQHADAMLAARGAQ